MGEGSPVASHLSMMSSEEKAMMDSGWTVICGGVFTRDKETLSERETARKREREREYSLSNPFPSVLNRA